MKELLLNILFGFYLILIEIPLMVLGFGFTVAMLLILGVVMWLGDTINSHKKRKQKNE